MSITGLTYITASEPACRAGWLAATLTVSDVQDVVQRAMSFAWQTTTCVRPSRGPPTWATRSRTP
jgi:hypothetical protein